MPDRTEPASRLPILILIGALLGLVTGLTIGERAAVLQPVGIAYAKMLEIAVFPYLICSLLGGLGGLRREQAPLLLRASWLVYVLVWLITFVSIFLLAFAIPGARPPAVLSTDIAKPTMSLLDLLIPANFAASLDRNFIPAIVVFSIIYGIAIQSIPQRSAFLETVDVVRKASVTIWMWVVYFAPVGVFALFASTSGTVDPSVAGTLAVYIALFLIGTFSLAFVVLPLVLSMILPKRYGEILADLWPALTLAMVTTISAAALPYIQKSAERLAQDQGIRSEEVDDVIRATIAISYVLTQLGNYFIALFIVYLGYHYRVPLSSSDFALLPFMTLLSGIGSPSASVDAVAFLTQWLGLPPNSTNLYIETMTITRYGQVAVSVIGISFVTLAVPLIYFGRTRIRWYRVAAFVAAGWIGFAGVAVAGRLASPVLFPPPSEAAMLSRTLEPATTNGIDAIVHRTRPPDLAPLDRPARLDGIRDRGRIRVGYGTGIIPFSYFNDRGELVGGDVAAAYRLAHSLHVGIEFVPIDWDRLEDDLATGRFDIIMAGAYVTPERLERAAVSNFHHVSPIALIVRSELAHRFKSYPEVAAMDNATIAVFPDPVLDPLMKRLFPKARVVTLNSYDELPARPDIDAGRSGPWTRPRPGRPHVPVSPPLSSPPTSARRSPMPT